MEHSYETKHGLATRVHVDPGTDYNGDVCEHCHTVINGVTHTWVEMIGYPFYEIVNCSREDSRKDGNRNATV